VRKTSNIFIVKYGGIKSLIYATIRILEKEYKSCQQMVNAHRQIYYENTAIMFTSCINRAVAVILSIQHSRPSEEELRFVEDPLPHNTPCTNVIGDSVSDESHFCKGAVFLVSW
jgi:hypothetical protein